MSLAELSSNVKLAREMAISGNYDSSGIYYETVLEVVQKLILGTVDTTKRGKYTLIQQQLIKEYTKLKELQKTLAGITMDIQSMPIQKAQNYHHQQPPSTQFMNTESPTKDFWFGTPKPSEQKAYHDPDRWSPPPAPRFVIKLIYLIAWEKLFHNNFSHVMMNSQSKLYIILF